MSSPRQPTSSSERLHGDEGVALVEFALVLPFLFVLFLGIFEYGTAWRNSTIIASSLRTAVRSVAQSRTAPAADMFALQGLMASLETTNGIEVEKVIIYAGKASAGGAGVVSASTTLGGPNNTCKTAAPATAPDGCNVYPKARLTEAALVTSNFGTSAGCASRYDAKWCPSARINSLSATNGPEWVGVYIEVTYDSVTSLLPNTVTVTDFTSSRLEPPYGA